jgi:predicted Zn-dependent protease with MMP-like domain
MYQISDEEFDAIVSQAIEALPHLFLHKLDNVAFIIEDEPTDEQRQKLHLYHGQLLFGLYEGIPLTKRNGNYSLVLPDKITIFKHAIELTSNSQAELKNQVFTTIWHEIGHYYGLDDKRLHELEAEYRKRLPDS